MNSGKTTAASSIAHGVKRAGYNVAGVKATGTGAFGDFNSFEDGGAPALDFTDVGMATTFRMPLSQIEAGFDTLVATAAARGAEVVVGRNRRWCLSAGNARDPAILQHPRQA